ncbi:MAG: nucleoside hydrolase [Coriobacteriaceae bacterium]|nr:nucleoside hydrolase [Coriobacteriaceae bacterium]
MIDTDPGTDDAIAFAVSTLLDGYPDRAFVSSYGNMPIGITHANLRKVLSLTRQEGRLFKGASGPFEGDEPNCGGYHGPDGLGGASGLIDDVWENAEGLLCDLADLICGFESCTYIAIGPLTNLASLMRIRPEVANHIGRLLIMGGGFELSNRPHGTEYNFAADPAADAEVFASGIPITLFPLDLTHAYPISPERISALPFEEGSSIRLLLEANCRSAMAAGNPGAIVHDAFPVLFLLERCAFETETAHVVLDRWGRTLLDEGGRAVELVVSARPELLPEALEAFAASMR